MIGILRRRLLIIGFCIVFAGAWSFSRSASGHGGEDHDHGEGSKPVVEASVPSLGFGGEGEWVEVTVAPVFPGLTNIYLADLTTNAPIKDATIEIETSGETSWRGRATATREPGIYQVAWSPPGDQKHDLSVTVSVADKIDLVLISGVFLPKTEALALPAKASENMIATAFLLFKPYFIGGGAAAVVVVLMLLAWGDRRRIRSRFKDAASIALLLLFGLAGSALAHGGEDHGDHDASPPPGTQSPGMGSAQGNTVFLSKASQFLLGIRTVQVDARQAADTVRLVGRVIPDPAGYARVQSAQSARVMYDSNFPIPTPGQAVKRGQTLAVLEPNLSVIERSDKRAALYKTESEIALLEQQLARWEQARGLVATKEIETARVQLASLRKEKAQISGSALGRDLVAAPVDGRVTDVHITPGEVVSPETVLVEIVNPALLRVEAVLYNLSLADKIVGGRAETKQLPNEIFDLDLLGVSLRINSNDQGLHLLFSVRDARGKLRLGLPVDVFAETGGARLKSAVPRRAVTEIDGRSVVFIHMAPEKFERRWVTLGRMVGDWVDVDDGVTAGERVVSQGVMQMKAIRK
ncbi:Efflux RND transporter periplasmic adaptor subunit [Azospirillaceae bacterium]